ncbi:hypothetical protein KBZ94_41520 [Streptomyces sp. RM72]|uniref:hypothetical protein n=1 Tax=Streptomyces sp. RM72 TaxID=1115510 RepID=UPI001B38C59A|nr:hypothetical protein [Streptomyces sp. RM72]MBQ0891313.1 hypothetical protein [Streptomyces sp. RM72]
MSPRRVKPRTAPASITDPVPGQFALFGSAEPWQPSACTCWPLNLRGCRHCKNCETCQDCRQCASRGCECACEG